MTMVCGIPLKIIVKFISIEAAAKKVNTDPPVI